MPIDFRKVGSSQKATELLSPRDIFNSLPAKATGFGYLRDVQGQVLDAWDRRRSERDVTIKMNTGAGKTIVGLLILQSCLNEGIAPALYVAPDIYLAQQVQEQAKKLGIRSISDPESTQYLNGQSIGIVNIHKLINGRSVFGGPGNPRSMPIPIGAAAIDDAHAALATVEAQTTLTILRSHELYDQFISRFSDDLKRQSASAFLDIKSNDVTAVLRIPFWAWADAEQEVTEWLHAYRESEQFLFSWPLVRGILPICTATVSGESIDIRPPCPPVQEVSSFAEANRRIYLTATLSDDSVLVTHFNATPESVAKPITPGTAADLGDRMIIAPQEIDPTLKKESLIEAIAILSKTVNTVVLVPSYRRADDWRHVADVIAGAEQIAKTVADLRQGHVGLVVLVNKYDGIDLPDNSCRVLVIDGLPQALNPVERREASILIRSDSWITRQLQRVEQGMGRAVRSAEDFCVVILLGGHLTQLVSQSQYEKKFSPATKAQLTLSREVAKELEGQGLEGMLEVIHQSLDRDEGWVEASRSSVASVAYSPGHVSEVAVNRRIGFDAGSVGQYGPAAQAISKAVNLAEDEVEKGWLQEELATYQNMTDPVAAQRTLAGAVRLNPRVTRPLEGVTYVRLSAHANQAKASAALLSSRWYDRESLLLGINSLLEDLRFGPASSDTFEDALEVLAQVLGFGAQRPERDTGHGPDVLWAMGGRHYLVIECKSESTSSKIWRRDVAQLAHSISWFDENYDKTCSSTPVIAHPIAQLERNAAAPEGTRILTEAMNDTLGKSVRAFAIALADQQGWQDESKIADQLQQQGLTKGEFLSRFTVSAYK